MKLTDYVIKNNIPQPIKLKIQIVKICPDRHRQGNDARYMRVWIDNTEVSRMVSEYTGLTLSKSRNAYETVIIHGCGMDMCFALVDVIRSRSMYEGYDNMFSTDYQYIERR